MSFLLISKVLPQDVAQLEKGLKQTQTELSEQKKQVSARLLGYKSYVYYITGY